MEKIRRVNPDTERGFSLFLIMLVALAFVLIIYKAIITQDFQRSDKYFEEKIQKSDLPSS